MTDPDESSDLPLSSGRLAEIFADKIVPAELSAEPSPDPMAVMFAGQTGAGKSTIATAVAADLRLAGRAVTISTDAFRAHHPALPGLMRTDVERANPLTDPDARAWVGMAVAHAVRHRYDVLYDGTLSRPQAARESARTFRDGGYRVAVVFVATPAAYSRLGILQRYQDQRTKAGQGRYVHNHDETYRGVLETADVVDAECLADEVRVYARGGRLLYDNVLDADGAWRDGPGIRAAIEAERHRPRDSAELQGFAGDAADLAQEMGPDWYERIAHALDDAVPLAMTDRDRRDLSGLADRLRRGATDPRAAPGPGPAPDRTPTAAPASPDEPQWRALSGLRGPSPGDLARASGISPDAVRQGASPEDDETSTQDRTQTHQDSEGLGR